MTEPEKNLYITLQGRTYYAVHQLAIETNLSLNSALDLLVAKGVKMINFERVADEGDPKCLDSLLAKLDLIHEQIDEVLEIFPKSDSPLKKSS